MLAALKRIFTSPHERELQSAKRYLEEAHDLIDLEWRMRDLDRRGIRWHA